MRIFLDTNVIVAAYEWQNGVCAKVYDMVYRNHDLTTSEKVIAESARILSEKFQVPEELTTIFIEELRENDVAPEPSKAYDVAFPDNDQEDPLILASAIAAGVDVLVTGDKAFRSVDESVPELDIRTPREFLDAYAD